MRGSPSCSRRSRAQAFNGTISISFSEPFSSLLFLFFLLSSLFLLTLFSVRFLPERFERSAPGLRPAAPGPLYESLFFSTSIPPPLSGRPALPRPAAFAQVWAVSSKPGLGGGPGPLFGGELSRAPLGEGCGGAVRQGGVTRVARRPPVSQSAASRRPHLLPPPGREREPPPPSRAGGLSAEPELDFTFTPARPHSLAARPSRVRLILRGPFRAFSPPRPLRLARAEGGGASRAARSQGPAPALNPTPTPLRAQSRPRGQGPPKAGPLAPAEPRAQPRGLTGRRPPSGPKGPLRRPPRRRGAKARAPPPQLPLSGGAAFYSGVVGEAVRAEKKDGKKLGFLGPALDSPPSGAARWGRRAASALAHVAASLLVCALPAPLIPPSVLAPSRAEPLDWGSPSSRSARSPLLLWGWSIKSAGVAAALASAVSAAIAGSFFYPFFKGGAGWGLAEA